MKVKLIFLLTLGLFGLASVVGAQSDSLNTLQPGILRVDNIGSSGDDGVSLNPQPDPPSAGLDSLDEETTGYVDPKTGLIIENIGDTSGAGVELDSGSADRADVGLNPQPDPPSSNIGSSGDDGAMVETKLQMDNIGSSGDDGVHPDTDGPPDQMELEPEPTGIEHEDIGLTDTTSDETIAGKRMNKADLIESLSSQSMEQRAVFVKLGDIKGESGDTAGKGNVEYTWKVEEGEAAKKPKEIVVVGSKVRGWDSVNKESIIGVASDPAAVETTDDLALFGARVIVEDALVENVTFSFTEIEVSYNEPAQLFGFIPMNLRQDISVDTSDSEDLGRVKVKMPWWHFLARKTVRPSDFMSAYETERNQRQLNSSQFDNANQKSSQYLDLLSDVLLNTHDTAMAIIRKIGG